MDKQLEKSLERISFWSKFIGYITVVLGGIQAFAGLFAFIIGSVPGIISIFLGIYLVSSGKHAERFLRNLSENSLNEMLDYLGKYFKLQGILMIISIILFIIWFFIVGFATFDQIQGGIHLS